MINTNTTHSGDSTMMNSKSYCLTLNNEVIFIGNCKEINKKFRNYKSKGIKVRKFFTGRTLAIGSFYK